MISWLTRLLTKQLIDNYDLTRASILSVIPVPHVETSKYGIIGPTMEIEDGIYGVRSVRSFVEKPKAENAPSNLAIVERYLLKPEIFEVLENQEDGRVEKLN